MKRTIREYLSVDGTCPYREWLDSLDTPVRARVQARVLRFELGNLGDHKPVGDDVWEARLTFGPGYRIYFGLVGRIVLLLLLGGDKSSQARDLYAAKEHWAEFLKRTRHGKAK